MFCQKLVIFLTKLWEHGCVSKYPNDRLIFLLTPNPHPQATAQTYTLFFKVRVFGPWEQMGYKFFKT